MLRPTTMKRILAILALLTTSITLTGCDWDDDNDDDFDPAEGKGAIIVDNNSADEIAVYIDGVRFDDVDSYSDEPYEVDPGVHRVVLDQRGGDRSYRDDIDVLQNKRTVLDVSAPTFDDDYDVEVFFD